MAKKETAGWEDLDMFTDKGGRFGAAFVTISGTNFLFNSGFSHKAKIQEATHVMLYYSEIQNAVLFQFTTDGKAKGALQLVHRGRAVSVGSRSFVSYYFLPTDDLQGRYEPKKEKIPKIGDAWTIFLDKKLDSPTRD